MLWVTTKNVLVCDSELKVNGKEHDVQDVLELLAKTRTKLEPRRGQKRESTQLLPDPEEEVEDTTLTLPVVVWLCSDSKEARSRVPMFCRFFCGCEHET